MPHVIVVANTRTSLRDVVELGRNGEPPRLRFHPTPAGDVVVLAVAASRIDGRPLIGGLAVVEWGAGALVRAQDLRVEIVWEAGRTTRAAAGRQRCVLCYGAFGLRETIVACACDSPLHADCAAAMISCPSCGAAAEVAA